MTEDGDITMKERNVLEEKYRSLFTDYALLEEAFNKPLSYKVIPSIDELRNWLRLENETDKIPYDDPNFVCGDFAVMLVLHAKTKHYDMGIISVYVYLTDAPLKPWAHAFNYILTTEGWVYIEPQNRLRMVVCEPRRYTTQRNL